MANAIFQTLFNSTCACSYALDRLNFEWYLALTSSILIWSWSGNGVMFLIVLSFLCLQSTMVLSLPFFLVYIVLGWPGVCSSSSTSQPSCVVGLCPITVPAESLGTWADDMGIPCPHQSVGSCGLPPIRAVVPVVLHLICRCIFETIVPWVEVCPPQ